MLALYVNDDKIPTILPMIDTHAHVAFLQFDEDRDEVIARARMRGVRWVEIGTDLPQSKRALKIAGDYRDDCLGATVGVHPSDVGNLSEDGWGQLEQLLDDERVIAVGEIGLDFSRGGKPEEQLPVLDRFIQLALQRQLPVVFHVRSGENLDAHQELITYLSGLDKIPRGVIHTFSGTCEQAGSYAELGLYLSFSGVVTFKNAGETAEAAKDAPLAQMLIETDCPYLAPAPYRGKRNEPVYVQYVAEKIAELRRVTVEDIVATTAGNALELFGLQK